MTDRATQLMADAEAHLLAGDLASARAALEQAAALATTPAERARALGLSASLLRLEGDHDSAERRAGEAVALAPTDSPAAVQARRAAADAALAGGRPDAAADLYADAFEHHRDPELLVRRATALAAAGAPDAALESIQAAAELLPPALATQALIDGAGALHTAGALDHADRLLDQARKHAGAQQLAAIELRAAAGALRRHDLARATEAADAARRHALDATDPLAYVGAAISLSEIAERRGDLTAAYAPLATGWVTLADLLGRDHARTVFAPLLNERRERWGHAAFARAKAAYERP